MRQDSSQVLQFSTLLAPRFALCSNFFVYFRRDGSRVCSRNSHSGVLVTGRASTPPHPGTRAPPGARGLHCPIVFTPTQSCFLFLFSCPHCILSRSHLEENLVPLPRRVSAGRGLRTQPLPRTPLILAGGEKFRYSAIISLPLSSLSPLRASSGTPSRGASALFTPSGERQTASSWNRY